MSKIYMNQIWCGNYLVEFRFKAESFYGGKWHKKQGFTTLSDFLPLGEMYRDGYTRKLYRLTSWEFVTLSLFGSHSNFNPGDFQMIKVSSENVARLHQVFLDAGRSDLIPVLLRYLGIDQEENQQSFRL